MLPYLELMGPRNGLHNTEGCGAIIQRGGVPTLGSIMKVTVQLCVALNFQKKPLSNTCMDYIKWHCHTVKAT